MTGRLIDVEATIETLSKDPLFPLVEKYGLSTVLEAMPTVEAIPVEWINKRLDDLNEYIDEHGENHMVLSKIQEAICLSRLLADWQEQKGKKNERVHSN